MNFGPDWYLGLPTSKPAMANEPDEMPSRATLEAVL